MQATTSRPIQYPWGTQCPVRWPKVFLAVAGHGVALSDLSARVCSDMVGFENYEVLASGEILFDLSRQQREFCSPVQMAEQLTERLQENFDHNLSTGLAADALTAIYTVRQLVPGLRVVPAWDAQRVLSSAPVEHLDCLLSGVSTLLKGLGYQQVGELGQQRDPVLTYRYGELGRAIQLLARGQSVPQQYWYQSPPLCVSAKGQLGRSESGQAAERVLGFQEKTAQRYARLGFVAAKWTLFFRRRSESSFQRAADLGVVLEAASEGESLEVQWLASEWRIQRVQQDLFDLAGDTTTVPAADVGLTLSGHSPLH